MAARTFDHDAMFYANDEEFTDTIAPFLREGIANGEAAAVATTRRNIEILRTALGNVATEVEFIVDTESYVRPAWTIAQWKDVLRRSTARGHESIRIVGEVVFGTPDEYATWTRYESAVNIAFAAAPAWIICPYDLRALPESVIADAARTHPTIWSGQRQPCDRYVAPVVLLSQIDESIPPVAGKPALDVPLSTVAAIRGLVRATVGDALPERLEDLLLALGEIAANALLYGRGERRVRLWREAGRVVCDVHDQGGGPADPLSGYLAPAPDATAGMGLWLARHVCDTLAIRTDRRGTTVRFSVGGGRMETGAG